MKDELVLVSNMRKLQRYKTRDEAGRIIAGLLKERDIKGDFVVLAIPNGGVEVASPIAKQLNAPLGILIVRKMQIPYNPEAGFGALTSLGTMILNESLVRSLKLDSETINRVRTQTERQIDSRQKAYGRLVQRISLKDKDIVLVDDGLASGFTMLAAVESVRESKPRTIRVAVPTAHHESVKRVESVVDQVICPRVERGFSFAVANAYEQWYDVPDDEVIELLQDN